MFPLTICTSDKRVPAEAQSVHVENLAAQYYSRPILLSINHERSNYSGVTVGQRMDSTHLLNTEADYFARNAELMRPRNSGRSPVRRVRMLSRQDCHRIATETIGDCFGIPPHCLRCNQLSHKFEEY